MKTKATQPASPAAYLDAIEDDARRADMKKLHTLIRKTAPKLAPDVASGMIGYGKFRYRTQSGREGDAFTIALSSRAAYISLYVLAVKDGRYITESYKKALPKADIGKSCVRFKQLAEVDLAALTRLIREGATTSLEAWTG